MGFKIGGTEFPTLEEWKLQTPLKNNVQRPLNLVKVDDALKKTQAQTGGKADMFGIFEALCELCNAIDVSKKTDGPLNNLYVALNTLENEAIKARRYYAATGPLIIRILSQPVDVFAAREKNEGNLQLADKIYSNFVHYAKAHWSYVASSKHGGEDVLAGRATAFPCGGIATALKIVFISFFGNKVPTQYKMISTYLITKPEYHCFDGKVTGNVKNVGKLGHFDGATIFNMHFYLEFNGKFYDPCMDTTYTEDNQVVQAFLVKKGGGALVPEKKSQGHPFIYLFDRDIKVSGFNGGWVRIRMDSFANSDELWKLVTENLGQPESKQTEMKALAIACGKVA